MCGWIKLHRSILENELWEAEPFTYAQAWVDILLNANYQPKVIMIRGIYLTIDRGQLGWSELTMSKRWKWSRDKVRRFLKRTEDASMIIQQKSQLTTIISICNYSSFQDIATPNDTTDNTSSDTPNDTADDTQHKKLRNKEEKITPECSGKTKLLTFKMWIKHLAENNEKPIPEDDSIFDYAQDAGLTIEFIRMAWVEFKARYIDQPKRYKDWRATFRNCIRANWFELWWHNGEDYTLTSKGKQAMDAMNAMNKRADDTKNGLIK